VYRKEKALRDKHYKLPYLWLRERMSFKKLKDLI
jgi:hypothetical protein